MKYVNPDSNHSLDMHSEDQELSAPKTPTMSSVQINGLAVLAAALGVGVIAFVSAWAARRGAISALQVNDLKIGSLEVDKLRIKNHERPMQDRPTSMEETGGMLRFELGSSDVYENGLE